MLVENSYLSYIGSMSRPIHKRKQIGLLTSLKTLNPATTGYDETLHDPDLLLQLKKEINYISQRNRARPSKVTLSK